MYNTVLCSHWSTVRVQLQTRHAASASRLRQGQRDSSDSIFELMSTLEKAEAHFGVTVPGGGLALRRARAPAAHARARRHAAAVVGREREPRAAGVDRERDLTRALRKLYGCAPLSPLLSSSLFSSSHAICTPLLSFSR